MAMTRRRRLTQTGYRALADLRFLLRQFSAFSSAAANEAGLPAQQHQALLAIKGTADNEAMTVGQLAARLLIAPHSAAELVKRLEHAGYATVSTDSNDRRRHVLALTEKAEAVLEVLSDAHLNEIKNLAPRLVEALTILTAGSADRSSGP